MNLGLQRPHCDGTLEMLPFGCIWIGVSVSQKNRMTGWQNGMEEPSSIIQLELVVLVGRVLTQKTVLSHEFVRASRVEIHCMGWNSSRLPWS